MSGFEVSGVPEATMADLIGTPAERLRAWAKVLHGTTPKHFVPDLLAVLDQRDRDRDKARARIKAELGRPTFGRSLFDLGEAESQGEHDLILDDIASRLADAVCKEPTP